MKKWRLTKRSGSAQISHNSGKLGPNEYGACCTVAVVNNVPPTPSMQQSSYARQKANTEGVSGVSNLCAEDNTQVLDSQSLSKPWTQTYTPAAMSTDCGPVIFPCTTFYGTRAGAASMNPTSYSFSHTGVTNSCIGILPNALAAGYLSTSSLPSSTEKDFAAYTSSPFG